MKREKIVLFYVVLMMPLLLLFVLKNSVRLGSVPFVVFLSIYCLIYNPLVQGYKLYRKGILKKNDLFKMLIPFYSIRYFGQVFLK